jgi:hypothetical protein
VATSSGTRKKTSGARASASKKSSSRGRSAAQRATAATESANGARGGVRSAIVRGTMGALAGGAAVGAAHVLKHQRNHRRGGLPIPRDLKLDLSKVTPELDVKRLLRQIGDAAEQVELRSEDVRQLSAQAKRLSRRLS